MQSITPVTTDQLLAVGQQPKAKFEIYNNASWINLCNLHSPIGLVGWWAFDEGSGMTAYDHSKNGNHGTLENMTAADWVDGKVGKALDFDGDNDFVSMGNILNFGATDSFSISLWILVGEDAVTNDQFIAKYDGTTGYEIFLEGDKARAYIKDGVNNTWRINSEVVIKDGEWHHLVAVVDRATQTLRIYVDGIDSGTVSTSDVGDLTNASLLYLGRRTSGLYFPGLIDEVRIYNRALTEGEIKALYELKGKNYLEDWSISLGGASMTPNPVGGTWSVTLSNEDGIFHPKHPTSAYKDYLVTGRKARLSIGGKYGGTDYYWQRIIGHMDEPSFDIAGAKINISGGDYMKFLEDVELRSPDTLWRSSQAFGSISSDGITGSERYNEADAMDIDGEQNNVTNWNSQSSTFVSFADGEAGSTYVGKMVVTALDPLPLLENLDIFTPAADTKYIFKFKYKRVSGVCGMTVIVHQFIGGQFEEIARKEDLDKSTYTEETIYFTTQGTGVIKIWIRIEDPDMDSEWRVDQFTIREFVPYWERYYELPAACKGIYRVVLNGEDVWQGEENEGWGYEESTRRVFFDINKEITRGTDNLVIHYFTTQALENMVADILVTAHLYADRAAALADMDYTDPAIDIDQVWFEVGDPALGAIAMICERSGYRFHFSYNGKPTFQPKPSGATVFTFTDQKHIASPRRYEDRSEIWNRIVIEGKKQANPINRDENLSSELRGEAYDQPSIDLYGERTKTIKNHLFETQASIDAMKASLLAEHKDPKWYVDFNTPYNGVPLELRDKTSWKERLSPSTEITDSGYIRDIKISKFDTTYKSECV